MALPPLHPTCRPSNTSRLGWRIALALSTTLLLDTAHAARSCDEWHVEFLSFSGAVEIQRAGAAAWEPAQLGQRICHGDSVRIDSYGQATVRLPDSSKINLKHNTAVTFESEEAEDGWLLKLLRGALHVISRDPRTLRFSTPYANAGLEGTEFSIEAGEGQTDVAVLEGAVLVTSPQGRVSVQPGQIASVRPAQTPLMRLVTEPMEFSRWASHYPAILDGALPAPDEPPSATQSSDASFFTARAARRLSYGRYDTAEEDAAVALRLAPGDAVAHALLAVITLSQGNETEAAIHTRKAVDTAPESVPALLAQSYVQQAAGNLEGALRTVRRATIIAPTNALAWSRQAELELANRDRLASSESAARAVALAPLLAHPHVVTGFAALSRSASELAVDSFEHAMALDAELPLARLGLGLAWIQQDRIVEGRDQLESAVSLDPGNALLRSYMAKAYDFENRAKLAATQLDLAKRFDPTDPTAWYYSSLHNTSTNRPVAALDDLRKAVDLSDAAPLHRSTLAVDEDLAARAAGHGPTYRDLGFEQLAIQHGSQALARDPTDYSALRLLASVYAKLPRHEMARVYAVAQATLLQPLNMTPLPPQLGEANLFILDEAGPSDLAIGEFSPLLRNNGLKLQASAVAGARGTGGEDVVLAGLHDRLSYNIGNFRFTTDGFRANNDLDQTVSSAFLQWRPASGTSVQAELRSTETESGDLLTLFDPTRFDPAVRTLEEVDTLRLGIRHDLSNRATLLSSFSKQDIESATRSASFGADVLGDGFSADVQHIYRGDRWTVSSGLFHFRQDRLDDFRGPSPLSESTQIAVRNEYVQEQAGLYSYGQVALAEKVMLSVGASVDSITGRDLDADQLNPKLGVLWQATPRTTVRAALLGTLQGPLATARQNIQPRLEPFQVAGFNQFFVDREGDDAELSVVALHHEVSADLFTGFEVSRRSLDASFRGSLDGVAEPVAVDERFERAYLYWTPSNELAVSAEYRRERIETDGDPFLGMIDVQSRRLPFEARYFHRSGFRAGLRASHVDQHGDFSDATFGMGTAPEFREDEFWVFDASFGYRLPNRRGVLSLNVDNLLDEDFNFQDTDPLNPSIAPERMAYFRFTLAFER